MSDTQGLTSQESRPRGPRLYHKKSRAGCIRCKQRRVKCDEQRPSCSSCSRHLVECVYQTQAAAPIRADVKPLARSAGSATSARSTPELAPHRGTEPSLGSHPSDSGLAQSPHSSRYYPSPSSSHLTTHVDDHESDVDLPDGPWRRLWELRLLHNSQTRMAPVGITQHPEVYQMWTEDVPKMAISFAQNQGRSSLLYIEFAHSALHMWTSSTDKQERDELIRLQQTYQLMCSKEQRRDIDAIPNASPKLLDYICLTALRILAHSLALVQTLSLDPWEPPLQWLYMGHGAGTIFHRASSELIKGEGPSLISKFVNSPPILRDPEQMIRCDFSSMAWLLDHPSHPSSIEAQTDQELNDEGVRSVYEKALSYTCSVRKAISENEPRLAIARRLGAFAVWVPTEFSMFIEQRRPRALVVLAHFMAIWLDYEDIWLIGRAGEWQIRCIQKNLPVEWSCKLDGLFARFKNRESQ